MEVGLAPGLKILDKLQSHSGADTTNNTKDSTNAVLIVSLLLPKQRSKVLSYFFIWVQQIWTMLDCQVLSFSYNLVPWLEKKTLWEELEMNLDHLAQKILKPDLKLVIRENKHWKLSNLVVLLYNFWIWSVQWPTTQGLFRIIKHTFNEILKRHHLIPINLGVTIQLPLRYTNKLRYRKD